MKGLKIVVALFILLDYLPVKSATCLSTGNGDWGNTSTWSCGSVPTCGDSVVIQSGHTVTITTQQDLRGCGSLFKLAVRGTIKFVTGRKLRLACNSRVYVFSGGSLVPGGGGGSSNELEICGSTMWQASDGTYTGPGCFPSTLTACSAVLPIELVMFEEITCTDDDGVCLSWETASELNNHYFELERSANGYEFEVIEKIPSRAAGGISLTHLTYYATDEKPLNSPTYYRLNQVDYDLSNKRSEMILSNRGRSKNQISVLVFPNPNSGNFTLRLSHLKAAVTVMLTIRDLDFKTVYTSYANFSALENERQVVLENLLEGAYLCEFKIGDEIFYNKVLIQN